MSWGSWSEFWAMGGKGFYVWGSYAVTIALIGIEVTLLRRRHCAAVENARRERAAR